MQLKFRKKVLLAKIEGTYGQDSTPTGAANAILTHNLVITPLEADLVNRDTDRPTLGNDLSIHVGARVRYQFDVEVAGAGGAVDTPPAYGPLLRACGMAETVNVATSVEYDPVSANEEAVTLHGFFDGQRHPTVGVRGGWQLTLSPKGIPYYKFDFIGLWADPGAVPDPVPDYTAFENPLAVTNDNTPTFSLHALAATLETLDINQGNEVVYRNVVGSESVQIVDRAPGGRVMIEAPDLATKNFFTTAKANTLGALQLIHGTAAGNRVQIDAANVQLLNPRYGESDGIRALEMDLSLIPSSAGDDEFKITTS